MPLTSICNVMSFKIQTRDTRTPRFPQESLVCGVFLEVTKRGSAKKYVCNHKQGTELGIAEKQIQLVVRT